MLPRVTAGLTRRAGIVAILVEAAHSRFAPSALAIPGCSRTRTACQRRTASPIPKALSARTESLSARTGLAQL